MACCGTFNWRRRNSAVVLATARLDAILTLPAGEAWRTVVTEALAICGKALSADKVEAEIARRDRAMADLDQVLATAGWDLWAAFHDNVPRTSDRLATWWHSTFGGRAILILDALSLRELPWVRDGAIERGFTVHEVSASGSELPAATTEFAKALGFAQRSSLENNGAGSSHRLPGAHTECSGAPWADIVGVVGAEPRWCFWHTWPDDSVHDLSKPGASHAEVAKRAAEQLTSEAFWAFVRKLAQGRRLIVTSDHGYAAIGPFADTAGEQGKWLADTFKGQRIGADGDCGPWSPPLALALPGVLGRHRLALGRRKWKVAGGYPTLAHGGLTILETLSPWLELSFKEV
jgi:hypothetical protein